jgi:hypothetical protein
MVGVVVVAQGGRAAKVVASSAVSAAEGIWATALVVDVRASRE